MRTRAQGLAVAALFVVLTAAMTWPQVQHLSTHVYDADDPLLSIWRVSWIAHILTTSPLDIFNGNIFHPEPRTLAYTDSVLLEGLVGAPLIWAGVSRVTTYNLLLLGSIALSGWAMWRYAYHLTGHHGASILAGIVFAFVPYRFEHYLHLELQATVFLPLTLLYLDRAVETGSRRDAWLMMASFVAQVYSCIYYSVFLLTVMVPVAVWRLARVSPEVRTAFLRASVPAAVVALITISPYAVTYAQNRVTLGERLDSDILMYSATLPNYLSTPETNSVHGWWSASLGKQERRLFPGVIALVLAAVGLASIERHRVSMVMIAVIGFIISLGLNTVFYEPLRAVVFPYRGLRAPARASILVFLALAGLAAVGWARIMRGRPRRVSVFATTVLALALLAEYRTTLDSWFVLPPRPPEVYRWLALQPRSVVAEVPIARADSLHAIADGIYMYNSTWHWQPIVNGYSGYFPKTFIELAENTENFPDEHSIQYLKRRGVDLLVIHGSMMDPEKFGEMTAALLARPDIEAMARFQERMGADVVFRLRH